MLATVYQKISTFSHNHVMNRHVITWRVVWQVGRVYFAHAFRQVISAPGLLQAHERIPGNRDPHVWRFVANTHKPAHNHTHAHPALWKLDIPSHLRKKSPKMLKCSTRGNIPECTMDLIIMFTIKKNVNPKQLQ